jgi:alpha-L-fucosidase 2
MEWLEDYEETDIGHRHISQAFGLYPAALITRRDKELYKAIEVTLNRRLSRPDSNFKSDMGWTVTWVAALFARLRKPERAYGMLNRFVSRALINNLWEIIDIPSMGGDVFQIDANLAYVASVCEILIQSHEDAIAIIPALPDRWHTGSFCGLRARGGYEIDADWCSGSVNKITVKAKFNGICHIELPKSQRSFAFRDENGEIYNAENSILTLDIVSGVTLVACD